MPDDGEERTCQECGKNRATISYTEFGGGGPVLAHLCEECYNQREGVPPLLSDESLVAHLIGAIAPELEKLAVKECPECGISYLEFRQALRLGCPHDYEAFKEPLDDLLERIHHANRHVGKVPRGLARRDGSTVRLEVLRQELGRAVEAEDFREAARLRDKMHKLEQEGAGKPEE